MTHNMKLIILDRDGVINEDSDEYVKTVDEWIPIPGSIEAIAKLSKSGFSIYIATNQSGIARKYFNIDTLDLMHRKLLGLVEQEGGSIESILYCPHGPDDGCDCRKPQPGLFVEIAKSLGRKDLAGSYTVGDSLRDLQAGAALSSNPVLVRTGKGKRTLEQNKELPVNTQVFTDLAEFAANMID